VRGSRTVIALVVAAGIVGCGSDGGQSGLTSGQQKALVAQLEAARGSAAAHDLAGTKAAVSKFRRSLARLRRAGSLSDTTARSLRIGAARLLARVQEDNPAPAPTPQTATTPAPTPPPPGQQKKHEEKKKHDKGKGHKEKDK
jgi:hypothetical protein